MGLMLISSEIRELFLLIIFKNQSGIGAREKLFEVGMQIFREGDLGQKIFGNGIETVAKIVREKTALGSLHNAYLQILACYGLVGLISFFAFIATQIYAAMQLYRTSKFYSVLFLALIGSALAMMFTNTTVLFTSPIDSYFLTVFVILVPKYVRNSILAGTYE